MWPTTAPPSSDATNSHEALAVAAHAFDQLHLGVAAEGRADDGRDSGVVPGGARADVRCTHLTCTMARRRLRAWGGDARV